MLLFALLTLAINSVLANKTDFCATWDSKKGSCVPVEQCAPIKALEDKLNLTNTEMSMLRRSYCAGGSVISVCCQVSNETMVYKPPPRPEKPVVLGFRDDSEEGLLPNSCGGDISLGDRIFGRLANINDYPWMALLKYRTEQGEGYGCGGALISKRYILTAAHCIEGNHGKPVEIRLGEYDINQDRDCVTDDFDDYCNDPCVDVKIDRITVHPQYVKDDRKKLNDIALIRLAKRVEYTDFIQPICIPDIATHSTLLKKIKLMEVAGWGKTKLQPTSNYKRKALVPVVDRSTCSRNRPIPIAESQICAGGEKEDSCSGDSGGPLMALNTEQGDVRYYVTGIVSFGPKKCATTGVPAVYTNVAPYITWIKENIIP